MCFRLSLILVMLMSAYPIRADDPAGPEPAKKKPAEKVGSPAEPSGNEQSPAGEIEPAGAEAEPFVLADDVRDVLVPLFAEIANAGVSRATVEMLVDSLVSGQVVESQTSTFQIASVQPNEFTIYLKEPEQRTRIYCDGKTMSVALAPDAYFRLPQPMSTQEAVTSLPVPMGPYPEPMLAMTLAGADPAISMIAGMRSIEIVDRDDFRGKIPAVHLRGVQADAVTWDLWMSSGEKPEPLRLLVDLTPMLVASDELQVPDGFSHQVRYDFLSWRVTGDVDSALFVHKPEKDAKEYESLEDYYASLSGVVEDHPLLGKRALRFRTKTLDGRTFDLKSQAGKVVVLDFWATWCTPCLAAMPVLKEVTSKYDRKNVIFLALNTGEESPEISKFLEEHDLKYNVLIDPQGKIADAYKADAIPLTMVIGKSGEIESVHVGFMGADSLRQRLKDELDVLTIGGRIASQVDEAEE